MQSDLYYTTQQSLPKAASQPFLGMVWQILGSSFFALVVCIYSIFKLSLDLALFLLKTIPKIAFTVSFYAVLGLFAIFLGAVVLSYSLLAVVSINMNLP